jgi:hypothetical protein
MFFPCSEQGIQDAIAFGGGPHKFLCSGPTTVFTTATIVIDTDVVLDGEGNLTINGNDSHWVLFVSLDTTAKLQNMTITRALGYGIRNAGMLTLVNVSVSDNHREEFSTSSGICNCSISIESPPSLTIIDSTISGNTGGGVGGGIANKGGVLVIRGSSIVENKAIAGSSSKGGGIFNAGLMTVSDSIISRNEAARGGGIYNDAFGNPSDFTITRTTITENLATSYEGGGLYNLAFNDGHYLISNSTISGNTSVWEGGGVFGQVDVDSSTISGNTARGMLEGFARGGSFYAYSLRNSVINGTCESWLALSSGGNVESPGDTCGLTAPGDQVNVSVLDLALGPLTDNGGPTETHALLMGSVAIDAAPNCPPPNMDQRGVARPQGDSCDAGAFELELSTPRADCLCEVQNINPNQVVLQRVTTGGKGSSVNRTMVIILDAVDAPGASCDPGEFSAPTPINLKMEDDRGNVLIDSAKTVVCEPGETTNFKREVFFHGPLNCENGAVPPPKPDFSLGTITATVSAPGSADYVESSKIKCFE